MIALIVALALATGILYGLAVNAHRWREFDRLSHKETTK